MIWDERMKIAQSIFFRFWGDADSWVSLSFSAFRSSSTPCGVVTIEELATSEGIAPWSFIGMEKDENISAVVTLSSWFYWGTKGKANGNHCLVLAKFSKSKQTSGLNWLRTILHVCYTDFLCASWRGGRGGEKNKSILPIPTVIHPILK